MKIKIQYIIICLFLLLQMLPSNAYSGEKAGEVSISPMVGVYVFDHDQDIKKDAIAALGLAYNFTENWAGEFMINYGRFDYKYFDLVSCSCEKEKIDGVIMHLDALYNFQPDQKLVPYLVAGVGGVLLNGDRMHDDYTAVNGGGGVKYFLAENVALRADARYLFDLEDSNNNAAFTVGMTFQFGGENEVIPAQPAAPAPEPKVVPIEEFKSAPVKEKVTIDLKVQFDFDKSDVKPEYHDNIKKLADFMNEYPEIIADIQGHTCNMGSSEYNIGLSQRRAESVKNYMVKNFGIEASRLNTYGYGYTMPIADNGTREGRIKNRRVYVIVSNGGEVAK
ncbi:MAG: OmpA family protein [Desulfosalsimonadaceae bacterium]